MEKVNNPHDAFFKAIFSHPAVAQDFLRRFLPASIVSLLDLETLTLTEKSFVDPVFKNHFSDLLFTVRIKGQAEVRIYILIEHKSYPEPRVAYQLFRYINRIWEREQESKKPTFLLSPILPLVIHHGKRRWRISTHFSALLPNIEALMPFQPQFQYILIDLNKLSGDSISVEPLLQAAMLLMKYSHSPEFPAEAVKIIDQFTKRFEEYYGDITQSLSRFNELVQALVLYVVNGTDEVHYNSIVDEIDRSLKKRGNPIMMTIAERLRLEGEQRGIEKGIEKGIIKVIINLLEKRFGPISPRLRKNLERISDENELLSLHDNAVNATSLKEFSQYFSNSRKAMG